MKLFIFLLLCINLFSNEKLFIVERENSSVAIIKDLKFKSRMENLHNLNHGVIKFKDSDGYLISRDGYVVKFDPIKEKEEKEYKTSKSAIGFVIGDNYVAVANYDDKSVDILTRDLKPIKKIKTGSKNVGIKIYKDILIFAQMDKDKVTVLKDKNHGKGLPDFEVYKEFKVGQMPFDAMIKDNKYIVGFFLTKGFGVIDLKNMTYTQIAIKTEGNKPVLKVPHFGFWSISKDKVFIPAVGDNKVLSYTNNFKFLKSIEVRGLPVFTSLSPKERYIAVTFSGKDFPWIQIVDTEKMKVIKTFHFKGKVLHVRWSKEKPYLYVSVNGNNQVAVINTNNWKIIKYIDGIKKPSGIFIFNENEAK